MNIPLKIIMVVLLGFLMSIDPCLAQKKKFDFSKGKNLLKKVKSLKNPDEPTSETKKEQAVTSEGTGNEAKKRKLSPPDVNEQITNARAAFSDKSYTETRFYVQQAIMAIELEIGHEILESLPESVLGNEADKSQDVVYSTGAGFVGMNVSREYPADGGRIQAAIANSSAFSMGAQMMVASPGMAGYDDNSKVTRYKGYKAVLEVDDYRGYKMSIPFGQSSIFILECQMCESESQLLSAADLFDINEYKTLLGEQ